LRYRSAFIFFQVAKQYSIAMSVDAMLRAFAQLRVDLARSLKGILVQAFGILSSALHGIGNVRVAGSGAVMDVDGTLSKFWLLSADALSGRLGSRPGGLDQAEAERRLGALGRNVLASGHRPGLGKRIWRRIAEPLVAILAVAAILSIFFGDAASAAIILVVLILSITLDLAQEHKAERAVDRLRQSVAIMVDVLRSGQLAQVACEAIVPGDVVRLKAGDLVPADGLILSDTNANANESVLTGEAYPAAKRAGSCCADTAADAHNALFAGTCLVSGEATMLVARTGASTMLGAIASSLMHERPPTAFEQSIHRLGYLVLRFTVFLSLFVLLVHLLNHRPILESFLFAIALAVGLTPELLPMVTTVSLARGALRLADRNVVVKRLSAMHDLGALDVLCTDKTGTLTEARIELAGYPDATGSNSGRVLELAGLNSAFVSGVRSPLDDAIIAKAGPAAAGWAKLAELPFDYDRRRVSVVTSSRHGRILITKGAPEVVLALSTKVEHADGSVSQLTQEQRGQLAARIDALAELGQRALGIAWRPLPQGGCAVNLEDEQQLVFAGYCVFVDPPKTTASSALLRLASVGVRVKIISGDHPLVVRHLIRSLGIQAEGLLTGADLEAMTAQALASAAERTDVFCRVSPEQKARIVRALRAGGSTVGFLGDGVNDAPAIRGADVGISVQGATEIARDAADIILLQNDLGVLADGIEEGRRTFANVSKYVRMVLSSNLGNMLSMAAASLWLPFLPLTAVQILINNLLYDASEIGIPFDRVEPTELARPHGWDMGEVLRFMLILGPLSSAFDLLTFLALRQGFGVDVEQFRTAWFLESMATQILVIFVIRTRTPAWRALPDPVLTTTSLAALLAATILALTPLGTTLGFASLPMAVTAAVFAIVAAYLAAAEAMKRFALPPG
jgi:P-type Mg2+ transporter